MAFWNNRTNNLETQAHKFQAFPSSNYFPGRSCLCSPAFQHLSSHSFFCFIYRRGVCFSFIGFLLDFSALLFPGPLLAGSCPFPILFPGKLGGARRRIERWPVSNAPFQHWAETVAGVWAGGVRRSARCHGGSSLAQLSLPHMPEEASGVSDRGLVGRHATPPTLSFSFPSYYRCFRFKFLTLIDQTVRGELHLHQQNMLSISHNAGRQFCISLPEL